MKKQLLVGFFGSFMLVNAIVLVLPSKSFATQDPTGDVCKWWNQTCPSNYTREVCLKDGTGNTCTCGDVSRECY